MNTAVCTLFEGDYHFGLAALTNSLFHQGYKGSIYAGYRGQLPKWAEKAVVNSSINWPNSHNLSISSDLQLHFLPLSTEMHLTNYKPTFMIELLENQTVSATGIFYFDPDIVIKCSWEFYENWINYGVALVHEITSHHMPASHPIRLRWKQIIEKSGLTINHSLSHYFNGGFCGISKKEIEFLKIWQKIINTAIESFDLNPGKFQLSNDLRVKLVCSNDQDALNIAAMCCNEETILSEMGPEAMDFAHGGWAMSHSVGSPKPWSKNFTLSVLKGVPPSLADRAYWANAEGPLKLFSSTDIFIKKVFILASAFIGRFYRKS